MAIPVARVHLKVAHAALPALLPTPPPKCKMLPLLPTSCVAAVRPKPPPAKPSRADADARWDARKIKPASTEPSTDGVVRTTSGHGSSRPQPKNATAPPSMSGRADALERWDARKKAAASPASSSSSSGTSHLKSSCKWPISRATSDKKRRLPQTDRRLDDGKRSSTVSNENDDTEEEEEILWKPRAMYAGTGFAVAAPECSMLPMPTAFLVPVA